MPDTPVSLGARREEPVEVDRVKLEEALALIRPAIQADGGDIEVVGVQGGVVRVSLSGACGTCPISTTTIKAGVKRILQERVPGVRDVVDVAEEAGVAL